jgi:voltage-gated potassium channel
MKTQNEEQRRKLDHERYHLLRQLDAWLDRPMIVLAFVWLALLILEWTRGISPALTNLGIVIWIIFILDFVIEFLLAPRKIHYLKTHWLTALSLVVPALRILRIFQALRFIQITRVSRGLGLLRFLSSINRGMQGLRVVMGRRGIGYVILLTLIVVFTGAAGMYAFEKDATSGSAFKSYGSSLWWTAMIMTTMGSQYWPTTPEGQMLCLLLAIYGFTIFGYVTAVLATFFIGTDREKEKKDTQVIDKIEALQKELVELRQEMKNQ